MLTVEEMHRIGQGIELAHMLPFVDDIEDYVWEVIFAHAKQLPTLSRARTKDLFDVTDGVNGIGWSAKTLVWSLSSSTCEFVIQRADVIKKRVLLGHPTLTLGSPTQEIGNAVLTHWRMKVEADQVKQRVSDPRVALLLKNRKRTEVVPYEESLEVPSDEAISWRWSNSEHTGLLGYDGKLLKYRWYPNQKQLFEIFPLDPQRTYISVASNPMSVGTLMSQLLS